MTDVSETPRTVHGRYVLTLSKLHTYPAFDVNDIIQIEDEAAALAHDRPSGSGLVAAAQEVLGAFYVSPGIPTGRQAKALDALRAALSGSSDPEAMGLDEPHIMWTEVEGTHTLMCFCGWAGKHRIESAKPESPA